MLDTFANDTAYLVANIDPMRAATALQTAIANPEDLLDRWWIKVDSSKSIYEVYTLNMHILPPIKFKGELIPRSNVVKYLRVYLDSKLTWPAHIDRKFAELKTKRPLSHLKIS